MAAIIIISGGTHSDTATTVIATYSLNETVTTGGNDNGQYHVSMCKDVEKEIIEVNHFPIIEEYVKKIGYERKEFKPKIIHRKLLHHKSGWRGDTLKKRLGRI